MCRRDEEDRENTKIQYFNRKWDIEKQQETRARTKTEIVARERIHEKRRREKLLLEQRLQARKLSDEEKQSALKSYIINKENSKNEVN